MIARRPLLLGTGALLALSRIARADDALTVGIVPQQAATTLAKLWLPLLRAWSSRAGVTLRFATAPDIPTLSVGWAAAATTSPT
jgi:ABC-type phosphate/phosphonate transport system substrate-binding protein